ncbi:TetR/AcrR family transcriptional regulator [Gordonia aquimaris]|uniref:TetR/AcrR family transcriptional regulator n=1 Tax=Gordonia aquimaris TaxID=2984863 RepID=A0A9X3I3R6_9ACTN|nr:TetR/AcrR family transcriptional regulator [Gordonia aquimaris]MCX2963225.1 TetR/AcrR family transcriptional regulator [Gordonia aquimaris]
MTDEPSGGLATDGERDLKAALRQFNADAATTRSGGRTARVGEAVIDAALIELSERGYANIRIDDVAARAGVNKTTIYRRWGSKSRLIATALVERHAEMNPIPDTGDVHADALTLLKEIWESLRAPWVAPLIAEATTQRSIGATDEVRTVLTELLSSRYRHSKSIFERAIARGELPQSANPELLLEAMCGPVYYRGLVVGLPVDDAYLKSVVQLVLSGFSSMLPGHSVQET